MSFGHKLSILYKSKSDIYFLKQYFFMAEKRSLVVRSAVREVVKDMRISDSFFEALDKEVESLIKKAMQRAKANGRSTLRDSDV